MKLPNRLKIIFWLLIIGFFLYLFIQRYDFIMSGATTATDIVILLIFFALLIIPLFQEVSLFGVSFKKEIDRLGEQISSLKAEIRNTVNVYVPLPSDSELRASKEPINSALDANLKQKGIEISNVTVEETFAPDDAKYLFSVRYALENEITRLLPRAAIGSTRVESATAKAYFLYDNGIINKELYSAIKEVWVICTASIHGQGVSVEAINFVREIAPRLIASLRSIEVANRRHYGFIDKEQS